MILSILIVQIVTLLLTLYISVRYTRLRRQKENEYYTDYRHNNLIIRVYKPEFEFQAIGKIDRSRLLDGGTLTQFYKWALIETK